MLEKTNGQKERAELLKKKYEFLKKIPSAQSEIGGILAEIFKCEPPNLEYRIKYIQNLFENKSIWSALTEYMRFEADAIHQFNELNSDPDLQIDIQKQVKQNRLMSELEQLKILVKIKLQSARGGEITNQFKSTGSNLNGCMCIGTDDS